MLRNTAHRFIALFIVVLTARESFAAYTEATLPPAFKILSRMRVDSLGSFGPSQILINRSGEFATQSSRWSDEGYIPYILFKSSLGVTQVDLPVGLTLRELSFSNGGAIADLDGNLYISSPNGIAKRIYQSNIGVSWPAINDNGKVAFKVITPPQSTWVYDGLGPAQAIVDTFDRRGRLLIDNAGRLVQEHYLNDATSGGRITRIMRLESPNVWRDLLSGWDSESTIGSISQVDSLNESGNAINALGDFVFSSSKRRDAKTVIQSLNFFSANNDEVVPIFSSDKSFDLRRLSIADNGDVFFSVDAGSRDLQYLFRRSDNNLINLDEIVGKDNILFYPTAMNRNGDLLLSILNTQLGAMQYSLMKATSLQPKPLLGFSNLQDYPRYASLADDGTPYWWMYVGNDTYLLTTTAVPEPHSYAMQIAVGATLLAMTPRLRERKY
ncbi:hypothetical protein [Lacipirellula parvula]|uniref:PEP-CTERM sorting domain-containing protein n=1 Tax=Lacipirellula parvula TaxID=2650471 RepID=A0A5K7X7S1_9BACT|nr:hypothetical protein [Lacipirellula parvula]BBO32814.1 hypothetical protein PLANPX_2426 [Lacipirellula parvula]